LGYLRVAQSMAALIGFIPSAIAPAAISYLSASSVADKQSYQHLKSIHLRGVWILLLVPTGAVCQILPNLIQLLFGGAYQQAVVLSWLCLWISLIAGVTSVLIQYLVVVGKTVRVTYASLVGVIFWLLSALVLVPRYSSLGFFISQFIGQMAGFLCVIKPSLSDMSREDSLLLIKLMVITEIYFLFTLLVLLLPMVPIFSYLLSAIIFFMICLLLFKNTLYISEKSRIKKIFGITT